MRSRPQLPALTGLRFIAAMQVLVYHAYPHALGPRWLASLAGTGFVGVSLFFVLSGFILSYNYEDALREGRVSWRAFWQARFARVYPVYLLGLLIALPPFFLYRRGPAEVVARVGRNVAASVFMAQAWSPRIACGVNCPGWSISVEALFYLVFPAAALLMLRVPRNRLPLVAAAAWAIALLLPVLYLVVRPDGAATPTPLAGGLWLLRLKYHPLARLAEFVLGMAVGSLFLRRAETERVPRWLELAAAGGIVATLAAGAWIPYPLLHNGLLAPLFALLIYALASGEGRLAGGLAAPAWETLGGASYALYILHVPVGAWIAYLYYRLGAKPGPWSGMVLMAGASLLLALAVFRWVEEPARVRLRRFGFPRLRPAAPRLAAATE